VIQKINKSIYVGSRGGRGNNSEVGAAFVEESNQWSPLTEESEEE